MRTRWRARCERGDRRRRPGRLRARAASADSPLWDVPNVIITPHMSGFRPDHWDAATALFAENLRRFAAGQPLLNVVDKSGRLLNRRTMISAPQTSTCNLRTAIIPACDPAPDEPVDVRTIADLPFHAMGRFQKPLMMGRCRGGAIEA